MVSLPALREAFGLTIAELQWMVTAYNLGFGGLLLVGGRLSDIFGKRKILVCGLLLLLMSSLLAGMAVTELMLVITRGVQGIGAALASPAALSLLTSVFVAPRERGIALGLWAACGATGAALGNVVGGLVTALAGWRWVFLLNVPVCVLLLALVPLLIPYAAPALTRGQRPKLKLGSAVLITAALVALILALSNLPLGGPTSPMVLIATLIAVILGSFFVWLQLNTADPMISPAIFRGGAGVGFLLIALAAGVGVGPYYVASIFMQEVLGLDALTAGALFLPWCVMIAAGAQISAKAYPRFGAKTMLTGGFVTSALGVAYFALNASDTMSSTTLVLAFVIVGLGGGVVGVSATTVALAQVSAVHGGVASGVANGSSQVGGALSVALVALIVTVNAGATGSPDGASVELGLWCAAAVAVVGIILSAIFMPGSSQLRRSVTV